MKQFTDIRMDSDRLAHTARSKVVDLRIAELVVAVKRAVRVSSVYRTITLSQYDELIIEAEKAIRKWMVTSSDRDIQELIIIVKESISQLAAVISPEGMDDLSTRIESEIGLLNNVGFFSS